MNLHNWKAWSWWWGAALGLLALAVLWVVWAFMPHAVAVEVAQAQVRAYEEVVEDDGRARARQRWAVTMPWTGTLERPALKEGHPVSAGQVLFWVHPAQPALMDARTQAELQARAAAAQAAWQRSARQTEVALVAWQRSAVAATRSALLAEESFVARSQVEAAVLDLQRDERSWQAAQAAERAALHELEQVRVSLATGRAAAGQARRAVRLEPVAEAADQPWRVLRVVQPHEAVLPAGAAVMEVGDVRHPEVVLPLLSQDALRIPVGSLVRLGAWAGGGPDAPELQGRVRMVEPMATTKVSALGLEEQRVNLVIDPDQALPAGDGYTVRAQVVLRRAEQALQVPVSAVFPMPGKPTAHAVFALQGSRARLVEVELKGRSRAWAWIGQGLQEGQPVVLYPPAALHDGDKVRVGR